MNASVYTRANRAWVRVGIATVCLCAIWMALGERAHAHPPPFFWMSDLSNDRLVGAELAIGNSELVVDGFPILAANVAADIAVTDQISVLARVPFVYAWFTPPGQPDEDVSAFGLGNVGLGLKFADSSTGPVSVLRYGVEGYVHAPTASDNGDAALAVLAASSVTLPDRGRYAIDSTVLRLRGSGRYEGQSVFLQGELGLDHYFIDDFDNVTDLLASAGLGLEFNPYVAVLAELVVVTELAGYDDDERRFLPSADLGIRYHNPDWIFGARLHLPFAEEYRDGKVIAGMFDLSRRF